MVGLLQTRITEATGLKVSAVSEPLNSVVLGLRSVLHQPN